MLLIINSKEHLEIFIAPGQAGKNKQSITEKMFCNGQLDEQLEQLRNKSINLKTDEKEN